MFSNVYGSSEGDVLNPNNGYWTEGDVAGGHIFDFVIDMNGIQDVIFVDELMTVETADNAFGDVGWDHRLQASKSIDEKVVFAVWTDDPDSDDGTVKNPDIYGWGYNVETDVHTNTIDFTSNTIYAGFYFFPFVAELTPLVDGYYKIPVSTTLTPLEYAANDPLAPVTHSYLNGIEFDADFFGSLTTQVFVNPEEQSINTSEVFTTTIEITEVENLGSFELEIDFNPNYLQLNSLSLGDFLGSSGRTIFPLFENIDNTNGLLQYAVATLGSAIPGPDGDGVLLEMEWTAADDLANDVATTIILQNSQMTEPNGTLIDFGSQNGTVHILACYQQDFDCDCDVDIVDVTMAAYAYGTTTGNPNYDATYDLDNDGDVDIVDITMVTYDYGWSCGKSGITHFELEDVHNENVVLNQKTNHIGNGIYEVSFGLEHFEQLGAYDINMHYDQSNFNLLEVVESGILAETGRETLKLSNDIDEEKGMIKSAHTSLGSSISGVSGSGEILRLKLKCINGEIPIIDLYQTQFTRIDAELIPFKLSMQNQAQNSQILSSFS